MNLHSFVALAFLIASTVASHADFPPPYNSERDAGTPLMSAAEAAASFEVPPGFKVSVFASEPDVQNPIAMSWDGRGRLWIAENYTYAERPTRFDMGLRDRVVIFDGTNGGKFTKRTVFTDDVQMLTSIEVGHGGVWLMCPPQLLFIPDRNGDDKPDGPAEVVLDGFTVAQDNYHNCANGLRWGPDGWLYGRCGHSCPGRLGVPGTPDAQRIPIRGGMWRFHPQRKVVEVLTHGTTNPWGHDWDSHGEGFFINTVTGHLWHLIPGAHLVDSNPSINPHVYERMDTIADHWHFDTHAGRKALSDGTANALGGGHAHIGMMIYLGDNWPAEYRGHLFTWNMHGRRANQDILERHGSGYVGKHGADVFLAGDKWFRGLDLSYGPDGGVFAIDWSDIGECHESTGVHRTSGRIFKITHGDPKRVEPFDLAKMSESELVKLHTHENEWWVRQARLELAKRAEHGGIAEDLRLKMREAVEHGPDVVQRLRALWTLYCTGFADEKLLRKLRVDRDEHMRTWAVRLLTDRWPLDTCMSERPGDEAPDEVTPEYGFGDMAQNETSALVRLALASALQRIPLKERASIARSLASWHGEDADDQNLPLMIWYGLIPVGDSDPEFLAAIATSHGCLSLVRRLSARRLAEDIEKNPKPVNRLLDFAEFESAAEQLNIVTGLAEGMSGWRKATKPALWDRFVASLGEVKDEMLSARVRELSVLFGDGRALDELKQIALDGKAELSVRKAALQTLIENRPPDLREVCEQLLGVRFLNAIAARGLSQFDDPTIGEKLARSYRSFHPSERSAVLETLLSRPVFARALLDEVAAGKIPRADVTPFHARQIRGFNDPALAKQLAEVWGELREPAADKKALMAKLKTQLSPAELAKADPGAGRVVFNTLCASCHRLYGQGGVLGPDLTGAGLDNLDYLLDNIADPSAVVNADFRMSLATLKDGRVLGGVVTAKTARTVTLRTLTETTTIENADLQALEQSPQSMMPEGLLEAVSATQVRDLIAYLMQKSQVQLPDAAR